jgi:hypothetical protein
VTTSKGPMVTEVVESNVNKMLSLAPLPMLSTSSRAQGAHRPHSVSEGPRPMFLIPPSPRLHNASPIHSLLTQSGRYVAAQTPSSRRIHTTSISSDGPDFESPTLQLSGKPSAISDDDTYSLPRASPCMYHYRSPISNPKTEESVLNHSRIFVCLV